MRSSLNKFYDELSKYKDSDGSESYEIKEQEWEVERKMLMGLIEKNQQYAYNAQEKWKADVQFKEQQLDSIKAEFNEKISALERENDQLK